MSGKVSSSSAWLKGVVQMFASQGVEPASLLREAGLDPGRLKLAHTRFTSAEINRLWQLAVARSGQPALGLDRQLARRFIDFDIAAHAMRPSPSLGSGLQALSRYLNLIGDSAAFSVEPEHGDRWLVLAHGADGVAPRQRIEFGMLALLLLCQRVTHRQLRPLAAEFVFPEPADYHPYRMAFQCPLRFGQPANRLRLARDDLAVPPASAGESLFALHERVIEARLDRRPGAHTSFRASEEIIRRLHLGEPRREALARNLGVSEAALEQRLRAEGTDFTQLLDDVRRELATHYLALPGYSPRRAASLLGWGAAAQFNAACKHWFGMAPSQYRQRLAAEPVTS